MNLSKPLGPSAAPRALIGRALGDKETLLAVVVFIVLFAVPYLVAGYAIYILPEYMFFGVLAMSVGLLWGFVGILSFGQAAFFAGGAYSLGILTKRVDMANEALLGLLLAVVISSMLAIAIGYFLFTGGVRESYFVLVTLALSVIAEVVANSQSKFTGGFNGLYIEPPQMSLPGFGAFEIKNDYTWYYLALFCTALIYVALRWLLSSKFGKVLVAIREQEERTRSLGFNTSVYKTAAFGLSAGLAGLAGALYGGHAQFVAPSLGGVLFSTEVVIWVALGGRSVLLGALLGAIALAAISNYLSSAIPEYWQLALGVVFMFVILFFKEGFFGLLGHRRAPAGGTYE